MELSSRLRAIAEQVPKGARLADIGTDHAYLPVWLLRNYFIPFAIASDFREGPLKRGMETAKQWGIPLEQIAFRCADGLTGILKGEVDTIVIAGMGGETIAHILDQTTWSHEPYMRFLLQPMSSIPELRRYLQKSAFYIEKESVVFEQGKYYTILVVKPGHMEELTLGEEWAGRQEKGENEPYRAAYLEDLIGRREKALGGMRNSVSGVSNEQIQEQEQILSELQQMREEWIRWQR